MVCRDGRFDHANFPQTGDPHGFIELRKVMGSRISTLNKGVFPERFRETMNHRPK